MTLERHRSNLIPDVNLGFDGRIFVTDTEGTFPMRGFKKGPPSEGRLAPPSPHDDVNSYRSYDPKRDKKRRSGRFKPNEPSKFGQEVNDITGIWGSGATGSASLQRKLRKLKGNSKGDPDRVPPSWEYDIDHPAKRFGTMGTWSSVGKHNKRKRRGSKDSFPRVEAGSIGRQSARSLDLSSIKAYKEKMKDRRSSMLEIYNKTNGGKMPLIPEVPYKNRRLVDERLPGVFFIIGGCILIALGVVNLLISYWHAYFSVLWTGILVLILGINGATHKGDYLTKWKNSLYIIFGILSSAAVMVTSAILLELLVPIIKKIGDDVKEEDIALGPTRAKFTNMEESIAIDLDDISTMVWVTLGLNLAAFVLCLVNYFTLTATMVAIGNHWEAVYLTTGSCDHRGHPRYFNPFEQISLSQATMLMGYLVIVLWMTDDFDHYWAPVWAGAVVLVAAVLSLFQGKRIDLTSLGMLAMCFQILAIMSLTFAAVYTLLGLTEDAAEIDKGKDELGNYIYGSTMASAVAEGIYILFVLINVIFIIGVLFRQCRVICCGRCLDGPEAALKASEA